MKPKHNPAFKAYLDKIKMGDTLPRGKFFKKFANKRHQKNLSVLYIRDEFWDLIYGYTERKNVYRSRNNKLELIDTITTVIKPASPNASLLKEQMANSLKVGRKFGEMPVDIAPNLTNEKDV